jgi:hypothetical protein
LPIFFNVLQNSVAILQTKFCYFALSGTYGSHMRLFVHSPCTQLPEIANLLPLKEFGISEVKQVWEHYWSFPSVSQQELRRIWAQITGRVVQFKLDVI